MVSLSNRRRIVAVPLGRMAHIVAITSFPQFASTAALPEEVEETLLNAPKRLGAELALRRKLGGQFGKDRAGAQIVLDGEAQVAILGRCRPALPGGYDGNAARVRLQQVGSRPGDRLRIDQRPDEQRRARLDQATECRAVGRRERDMNAGVHLHEGKRREREAASGRHILPMDSDDCAQITTYLGGFRFRRAGMEKPAVVNRRRCGSRETERIHHDHDITPFARHARSAPPPFQSAARAVLREHIGTHTPLPSLKSATPRRSGSIAAGFVPDTYTKPAAGGGYRSEERR